MFFVREEKTTPISMKINGLILFGDSVLFGTGASSRDNGCGRILRSLTKIPILIKGRNNDSSKDGLARLESDVLKRGQYSHVILLFGNNDCRLVGINKPLVDLENYRTNLSDMIKQVKNAGKSAIISNLQPIESEGFYKTYPQMKQFISMTESPYQWHKRYSDVCEEISRSERIPLLNIRSKLEPRTNEVLASDGLHPNDLGHKIIAQTIFELLNQ